MDFHGFDWDDGNLAKCKKHGVTVYEIESLFRGTPLVGPDLRHSAEEARFRAAGRTGAGRSLFIVFTWRRRGPDRLIRPISARYMHRREAERYEQQVSGFRDR